MPKVIPMAPQSGLGRALSRIRRTLENRRQYSDFNGFLVSGGVPGPPEFKKKRGKVNVGEKNDKKCTGRRTNWAKKRARGAKGGQNGPEGPAQGPHMV